MAENEVESTLQLLASKVDSSAAVQLSKRVLSCEDTIRRLNEHVKKVTAESELSKTVIKKLQKNADRLTTSLKTMLKFKEKVTELSDSYSALVQRLNVQSGSVVDVKPHPDEFLDFLKIFSDLSDVLDQVTESEGMDESSESLNSDAFARVLKSPMAPLPKRSAPAPAPLMGRRVSKLTESKTILHVNNDTRNLNVIRCFNLFASLPVDIAVKIACSAYEMRRGAGQHIITKGETGVEIFFLVEGKVVVMNGDQEISTVQAVSFFGELGVCKFDFYFFSHFSF
jgi:myosin heavy subunit